MRVTAPVSLAAVLLGTGTVAFAQSAPIVKPGAPGQPSRVIDAGTATRLANTGYSPADVAFMQHMIYPGDIFNPQTQTQATWPAALAAAAQASRAAK